MHVLKYNLHGPSYSPNGIPPALVYVINKNTRYNDNIVIDKPDQRSALDQDCDRKFGRTLKVNKQGTHTIKKYN